MITGRVAVPWVRAWLRDKVTESSISIQPAWFLQFINRGGGQGLVKQCRESLGVQCGNSVPKRIRNGAESPFQQPAEQYTFPFGPPLIDSFGSTQSHALGHALSHALGHALSLGLGLTALQAVYHHFFPRLSAHQFPHQPIQDLLSLVMIRQREDGAHDPWTISGRQCPGERQTLTSHRLGALLVAHQGKQYQIQPIFLGPRSPRGGEGS